jgi:glycosyltransferase involved in cell wall biosynthesis
MRLVHTVERYAPAIGGAERVVQRVSEGLAARGHAVTVVTSGPRESALLNGVRVERFPVEGNSVYGTNGPASDALALVESLEPDLVFTYAAQTWTSDVLATRLDSSRRYRLVHAPCGFSALHDPAYAGYFERLRSELPRYDALVFHSSCYQDWTFAQEAGVRNARVIRNGADPIEVHGRGAGSGRRRVVTVGSHVRSKGHADFVRATRRLAKQSPTVGTIVAPARHGLDAIRGCNLRCRVTAATRGSAVRVVDGARDPEAVARELAAADLFLFPSQIECAPLAILEAMAAGLPWVSYDVGNVCELAGGLVVGSFEELVTAAEGVLGGSHPGLGRLGVEAWARDHRWPAIVEAYETLFAELVGTQGLSGAESRSGS